MDSLLELSKYLPPEFQSEDKLIDILELILSTRISIDILSAAKKEKEELPILPTDLQGEIVMNVHPYYANKLCSIAF